MEGGNINNNNNHSSAASMMMENGLLYPMIMIPHPHHHHNHHNHHNHTHQNHQNPNNLKFSSSNSSSSSPSVVAATAAAGCYDLMDMETTTPHNPNPNNGSIKAKILAHPHYPRLLSAYLNCQKVGAPPEVVAKLEEAEGMAVNQRGGGGYIGEDPGLDQFMEAYCEMLSKYEQELTKPYKEAMLFLSRIECQFKTLTLFSSSDSPSSACGDGGERNGGSSEDDIDVNDGLFIDPSAEDRELKGQLLRKYSGYLGSLRQEFMKKKKKGKLPKEARQQLLEWWTRHYKWPYPSESQKLALAESTGLDQKQINNWFINQRKRHWKPSEDMQFMVMDAASHPHGHAHPHFSYMDTVLGNPYPMDVSSTLM